MQMLSALLLALAGADWPDYRGPGRDGHASGAEIPLTWSETENVTWKTPVHGRGWSSPIVFEGRIWLTTATEKGDQLSVLSFDLESGEALVDRVLYEIEEPDPVNPLNSYASPSPCVAPGRVYVSFGTYGTACLDAETGEAIWERRDLRCEHIVGPGSSPFLHEGRLYVHLDGGDVQYVVALDAKTGSTIWKRDRSVDFGDLSPDMRKAYSTPIIARVETEEGEREELISSAACATYGYDPATGKELWRVRHPGFSMSSRPLLAGDRVVVTTGFMRPELWAFRFGLEGDVTDEAVLWNNRKSAPTMPSPVYVDGLIFQVSDSGMVSSIDAESGESVWRERLSGAVSASLLAVDDLIYAFDRDGKTTVFEAGPEFTPVAESKLDEGFMASPAVVGDALIVRTVTHLYRIEDAR